MKNKIQLQFTSRTALSDFVAELETKHDDYVHNELDWEVIDIVYRGERAFIKSRFIEDCIDTKFDDPAVADQVSRILRNFSAPFNALKLTVVVYRSLLFMKSPILQAWESAKTYLEDKLFNDIDGNGTTMSKFVESVSEEVLLYNRAIIAVDYPTVEEDIPYSTYKKDTLLPILKLYRCKDIISWNSTKDVYGRDVLFYVVLKEHSHVNSNKGFFKLSKLTTTVVYILENEEFSLLDYIDGKFSDTSPPINRMPTVTTTSKAVKYQFYETEGETDSAFATKTSRFFNRMELVANGKPLDRLPLYFAGGDNSGKVCPPPFLDLANLNKSYNIHRAKLGFSLYHVTSPVPYMTGVTADDITTAVNKNGSCASSQKSALFQTHEKHIAVDTLIFTHSQDEFMNHPDAQKWVHDDLMVNSHVGGGYGYRGAQKSIMLLPNNLLLIKPDNAKVGWLTYNGEGLSLVVQHLDEISRQMTVLGARILNDQRKDSVTAETANIERIGENAGLANHASTISKAVTNALLTAMNYGGIAGSEEDLAKFSYKISTETLPQIINPDELRALIEAITAGVTTREHVAKYLVRRGFYPDDISVEDIIDSLTEEEGMMADVIEARIPASLKEAQLINNTNQDAEGNAAVSSSVAKGNDTAKGDAGKENSKEKKKPVEKKKPASTGTNVGKTVADATPNA